MDKSRLLLHHIENRRTKLVLGSLGIGLAQAIDVAVVPHHGKAQEDNHAANVVDQREPQRLIERNICIRMNLY